MNQERLPRTPIATGYPPFRYYLDFLWAMTEKEIKARYKKAVFGFLWVILNPLLQMLIIGVIFSFFINIPNYFAFLFIGLLLWGFVSLSLSKTTPSFVYERTLLQKANFPKSAIPISIILSNFFHMIVSLGFLLLFLTITGTLPFPRMLVIIPTLIWLLALTIGFSLLTSSLQVRFRDINFFVQSLLMLLFYATPILYNLELIPPDLRPAFALNPLTSIFELSHYAMLGQGFINAQILMANSAITLVIVAMGLYIYNKEQKHFVDWL